MHLHRDEPNLDLVCEISLRHMSQSQELRFVYLKRKVWHISHTDPLAQGLQTTARGPDATREAIFSMMKTKKILIW